MERINNILTGFLSSILGNVVMFFTTIFLTRFIPPNVYGEFRFIFSFVSIAVIIFLFGRDSGIIYYVQDKDIDHDRLIYQEIVYGFLGLIFGLLILYGFQDFIVKTFLNSQVSLQNYQISILMIPLWGIFNLFLAAIKVRGMINYNFLLQNFIQRIIRIPFFLFFVMVSPTFYSLAFSMIISQAVLVYLCIKKITIHTIHRALSIRGFFKRLKYSVQLGINSILVVLLTKVDVVMVGKYTANEKVAIYDICVLLSFVLMLPFIALVKSTEPVMQKIFNENETRIKYFKNLKLSIELSLCVLLVFLLSSSEILYIFGQTYTQGDLVFKILCIGFLGVVLLGSPIEILNMNGYTKLSTTSLILAVVLNVVLNYYFIPIYGIVGAGLVTVFSLFFSKLITYMVILTKFKLNLLKIHLSYFIFFPFLALGLIYEFNYWALQVFYSCFISILFFSCIVLFNKEYRENLFRFWYKKWLS